MLSNLLASRQLRPLFRGALLALLVLLSPQLALATSFDFVSSAGRFSIAQGVLSLGNGLTISAAELGGMEETTLAGATVVVDSIVLDGTSTTLAPGIIEFGIDDSSEYAIEIYQSISDGGALLFSAVFDPGSLLVNGTSAILSGGARSDDLSSVAIGLSGFSNVLEDIATTQDFIDFNVTLSAAGQQIASQIDSGGLVLGSVAGSVATFVPEPTPALLTVLGLAGLSAASTRESRRRP